MKKSNIFIVIASIAFMCILALGVSTLTLKANPPVSGDVTTVSSGKWAEVCCGATCRKGEDYCIGTGSYVCCK